MRIKLTINSADDQRSFLDCFQTKVLIRREDCEDLTEFIVFPEVEKADVEVNFCFLVEEGEKTLIPDQKKKSNCLLKTYVKSLGTGGEAIPYIGRHTDISTVTESFLFPKIEDLLHDTKLIGSISVIDVRAGYYQVNRFISDKTAFVTQLGTFHFNRVSFGLKNAPMAFKGLIGRFYSDVPDVKILALLEDIIDMFQFSKMM
ncbi:uncharacterized protein NPIL_171001 [Nephila pilipes]|uniref:Uncharacterized protein n=1 Tax=Nephila pilipes TaxID=299642 RepID=A0A8X6MC42_NEPPI|nr:uncharacterized protein NPIL_171001 [Nephila pilipes]